MKQLFKGRGSQIKVNDRYQKNHYVTEHLEGLDIPFVENTKTEYIAIFPKKIVNKIANSVVPMMYSMNPYQGCEHGCIYCYARETHPYWGLGAGLDFERKILYKPEGAELLEKQFNTRKWKVSPIILSGNTDCYQPIEKKLELTKKLLEVCLKYKHPVSIITKNSMIKRDLDILMELAKLKLVHVSLSITSFDNKLRSILEPRTASVQKKLEALQLLSSHKIPVNVMVAPIIPSLNSHEIPTIIKRVAELGALSVGYTNVRLNGEIAEIFEDWLKKFYPDRANKVLNQIKEINGGNLYSRGKNRMKIHGETSFVIKSMFRIARKKYLKDKEMPPYDLTLFQKPSNQLKLF